MTFSIVVASLACATSPPLFEAAYRGDAAEVGVLLDAQNDPDEATRSAVGVGGWTPLMISAAEGHPDVVELLLNAEANVNARNEDGRTALMFAARYANLEIVKRLISSGADVNVVPSSGPRWPALFVASQNGHDDVIHLLVERGADVGYRDEQNTTAVQLAYNAGHDELGEFLIESWPGPLYRACLPVQTKEAEASGGDDPKLVAHFLCRIVARGCKEEPNGEPCQRFLETQQLELPPIDSIAPWK